ncbi:DUF1642 domain-containing protein [Enterococcus faecium]|uniref:DUF1642 domain-containing protein n=1 Tax=Enterococcus faecium TaxID=1352 RepID=UPI000CF312F0|nr:DUF1642 domain-containing protein [Enterococcus faecium]MDQ8313560.1 DUF1642 domain-containing protein [Enterococcus faecium]NTR69530.1 DUF1642 domain-containing protein [Enterococcus faecium]NTS02229.1 DUF1642 domain-containing protein [Enterococcus faecium]PQG57014.1 hypothetical protein CUS15_04305 [Enterococcus faecium]PQG68049.1 hypothetical protein CUS63_06250 [Enterococcus faecium]
MDELITKVEQWAKDKGLDQADPKAQFLKVAEEFGEIASAMARSNDELFKDSVGDVIVTLIILSMQKGTNVQECLEMAYNEIKGRTGKMVDGVFVKSSDLKQLDEPQKPVIPQLVAGWLEKFTDPFTKAEKIAYLIKSKDGDSYYFCDWFVRDGILTQEQGEELLAWATRQSYETLLSLYNGYEVEKEPLYEVIIGDLYLIKKFNNRNDFCFDTSRSLCTWEKSAYQLTEAEIKEIDERYWPFAVPVEEVVEV